MEAAVTTVWRMASTQLAAQAVEALEDAGHRSKHRGRTLTVSHHHDAIDGVTALVENLDPEAEKQP